MNSYYKKGKNTSTINAYCIVLALSLLLCATLRGLLYKNSLDCLVKTVHNEGFWALYKGFIPCWLRMGPWSLTFWLTYEQIRNLCGTSAF